MPRMNSVPAPQDPTPAFTWLNRIYYEDTDAGGIVFYANYLKFFERARTEWLRAGGIDQHALSERSGTLFVVRRTTVDYLAPARLDDLLRIDSRITRLGRASVEFTQTATVGTHVLATGTILVACVDGARMRPTALPPEVVVALTTPVPSPVPGPRPT
ncbi:MAG: tol-pal system-associated acyl-CoA thioesterase [Janthinobacterium lividum]